MASTGYYCAPSRLESVSGRERSKLFPSTERQSFRAVYSRSTSRDSFPVYSLYSESQRKFSLSTQKPLTQESNFINDRSLCTLMDKDKMLGSDVDDLLQETADSLSCCVNGMNIFLVGMMGCGKSTVGRILSDALGYGFFDSDTMIEKSVGVSVATIFQDQGEASFRELEIQAVRQLSSMENLVVATGGGVVLRDENWRSMSSGTTVWIDVPLADLARRVVSAGLKSRPILSEGASSDQDMFSQALNKLTSVFAAREQMYRKSAVRVSLGDLASDAGLQVSDIKPKLIALQILLSLKEHLLDQLVDEESDALVTASEFLPLVGSDFEAAPQVISVSSS